MTIMLCARDMNLHAHASKYLPVCSIFRRLDLVDASQWAFKLHSDPNCQVLGMFHSESVAKKSQRQTLSRGVNT